MNQNNPQDVMRAIKRRKSRQMAAIDALRVRTVREQRRVVHTSVSPSSQEE
jgi:hypothetical protein